MCIRSIKFWKWIILNLATYLYLKLINNWILILKFEYYTIVADLQKHVAENVNGALHFSIKVSFSFFS